MSTVTKTVSDPLPQAMMQHTYSIMYGVEGHHWWFVGRRRIIESFVERTCRDLNTTHPHILDVGCGTGANLEMLDQFGEAEGVDVSTDALEFCRARGLEKVHLGEAEKLPFEDCSFDLVTGLDVVEHLDDDIAGLREMHRVLKPGGRIMVFVPAFMWLWGVQDDISHHRRRYTLPEIKSALVKAGFEIERGTYANITFFLPILLGRLLMRVTGIKPASENNITIGALNGFFGSIFGAERFILRGIGFPVGVSAICVARKGQGYS
jgi:SAM-dependent methyltransferase